MKRREFITLIGGAAAWPCVAGAQQPDKLRLIGVLISTASNDREGQNRFTAFRNALQGLGWTEGRNVRFEVRWAGGDLDRINTYAAELVAIKPDVILAISPAAVARLRQDTRTIPIVFVQVPDPVGSGFVASLAKPGGNITGFTTFEYSIGTKWLELLKEIAPTVRRVSVIIEAQTPGYALFWHAIETAAPQFAVEAVLNEVLDAKDIEHVINTSAQSPNSGLIILPSVTTVAHRELIIGLATRNRMPAVYPFGFFATSGGLVSYGIDSIDVFHRAASYVARVLQGEKAADLPVQQPTKFELVINLKAAKQISLKVPESLLTRADQVIE